MFSAVELPNFNRTSATGLNAYAHEHYHRTMNAKDAWLATMGQLQTQLNRATYDTWLRHADLFSCEDGRFVVSVPNAFTKDWIERNIFTSISTTLARLYRRPTELQIIVYNPIEEIDDAGGPLLDLFAADPLSEVRFNSALLDGLHAESRLDSFITGDANRYAALLARAVVDGKPGTYSPAFFHGDMGLGKTHLLQAIARGLVEKGQRAVYLTAEEFTVALITAIQTRTTPALRERFRLADAVLIDDVGFIEGKDQTQAELVAIWDAIRNRGKTILFAGDKLPREMTRLSKDMKSRLSAGPIATLEHPDFDLRRALVTARCKTSGLSLPAIGVEQIAAHSGVSVRDLHGMIDQLQTYTRLTGQPITIDVMVQLLSPLQSGSTGGSGSQARSSRNVGFAPIGSADLSIVAGGSATGSSVEQRVSRIVAVTAQHFRLTVDDLLSRKRTKDVVNARQIAMYLARELTDYSLTQIAGVFGGRDHTTILHGCSRVTEQIVTDPGLTAHVERIKAELSPQSLFSEMRIRPNSASE